MGTGPDRTAPNDTAPVAGLSADAFLDTDWADPAARTELPPATSDQLRRYDLVLGAIVLVLTIGTAATLVPGLHLVILNGRLDLVLNTLTAVAAAGAAALAWIRYRIEREVSALFESSAFLVLFMTRALLVWISIFGLSAQIGLGIDAPEQWPIYGWTLARLGTAVLLIIAAGATLNRTRKAPRWKFLVQVGPALLVLGGIVILSSLETYLPPLITPGGFDALKGTGGSVPAMNPPGIALQVIVAMFYVRGAQLYREVYRQRGRRYAGFLSIALVTAGFAQVNWAILPGISQGVVTADDLLRATFSVIILLGIDAQSRADVRALRLANARLQALRSADAERATLEASTRLAREVHDGLSQDLWLAKLTQARLAQVPGLPKDAKTLTTDIGEAVDRALGGARNVLATMRTGADGPTVGNSLERVVEDFGERSGILTEYTSSGAEPALPSRTGAELIRIVSEALTNVRKHADATVVRVNAVWGRSTFEVSITDNGRGFDPASVDGTTFGLVGMRERAELIGADVEIESRHGDGTKIVLRMPGRAAA
jgi:signal transduction histidine kinase